VNLNGKIPFGATPLDDISGLKLTYITTLKELNEAEFQNITQKTASLILKPPEIQKLMSRKYLYKVHKLMLGDVWSWAGKKRISNKSVGVDKMIIDIELEKLIKNLVTWEDFQMEPLEVSARIHNKLVKIHPFENGNGRWSRIITNLYLSKKTNQTIKWPEKELYIRSNFRKKYIDALKKADDSDYSILMDLHKSIIINIPL